MPYCGNFAEWGKDRRDLINNMRSKIMKINRILSLVAIVLLLFPNNLYAVNPDPDTPRITVKVKSKVFGYYANNADIACGGIDSDVHKADVEITCEGIGPGVPVEVSLIGGKGFQNDSWYGSVEAIPAVLTIKGNEIKPDCAPVAFISPNKLIGELRSSNKLEKVLIKVNVPSLGLESTAEINFIGCDIEINYGENDNGEDEPCYNIWHPYIVKLKFREVDVTNHEIKVIVSKVEIIDEEGETRTMETARDAPLVEYVELDEKALINHSYDKGIIEKNGFVSKVKVAGNNVVGFSLKVFDFNAWN